MPEIDEGGGLRRRQGVGEGLRSGMESRGVVRGGALRVCRQVRSRCRWRRRRRCHGGPGRREEVRRCPRRIGQPLPPVVAMRHPDPRPQFGLPLRRHRPFLLLSIRLDRIGHLRPAVRRSAHLPLLRPSSIVPVVPSSVPALVGQSSRGRDFASPRVEPSRGGTTVSLRRDAARSTGDGSFGQHVRRRYHDRGRCVPEAGEERLSRGEGRGRTGTEERIGRVRGGDGDGEGISGRVRRYHSGGGRGRRRR
mmetsp:Transcript_36475/g.109589  ORF Transcript_36475/g.109589 Transcript_36475/m.109589 type:complete len:250 (-) Transcript_36475:2163-2912(-)